MRSLLLTALAITVSACQWRLFSQQSAQCKNAQAFFAERVEAPILQSSCSSCHIPGGLAQGTRFILDMAGTEDATRHNFATISALSTETLDGTPLLLAKPSGAMKHTGGNILTAGGAQYNDFQASLASASLCQAELGVEAGEVPPVEGVVAQDPALNGSLENVAPKAIAPRIRRLTGEEIAATYSALLGHTVEVELPEDSRQMGFSPNADLRVTDLFAQRLDEIATELAENATFPACSGRACASSFVDDFGRRAFRRPVGDKEALLAVYDAGVDGATHKDGMTLLLRTMLQSPELLYVSELGLDAYEIAASMAYAITGAPPDAQLSAFADSGAIIEEATRRAEAIRLLDSEAGKKRMGLMVAQWLTIDKASANNTPSMVAEMEAFTRSAIDDDGGSLARLLGGLPLQKSFLSTFAHGDDSAPVLRGVVMRRRVLCQNLQVPPALQGRVTVPQPQPGQTTRERFAAHSTEAACSGCHALIDPLGFAFEGYDGRGNPRSQDEGKPVDTTGELHGTDQDAPFDGPAELLALLSGSAEAKSCFARQVHRFYSAQNEPSTEAQFFAVAPAAATSARLRDIVLAFVTSPAFVVRSY